MIPRIYCPPIPDEDSAIELADLLGVTQPLVSNYETGELRLHGDLIVQLAKILGTTADELLGLDEALREGDGSPADRSTFPSH